MQQALEALENSSPDQYPEDAGVFYDAITALRTALEQPEQEPVAKVVSTAPDRIWLDLGFDPQDEYEVVFHELHDVTWSQDNASGNGIEYVRADTVPPAAQPTCPECKAAVLYECVACSSNNYPATAKRQWDTPSDSFNDWWNGDYDDSANPFEKDSAAYWAWAGWKAAQRPWQGLTDDDWAAIEDMPDTFDQGVAWAAARLKERNT